jgi:hypothetical protein
VLVNLENAITGAGLIKRIRSHGGPNQLRMTVAGGWTRQQWLWRTRRLRAQTGRAGRLVEAIERLLQPMAMGMGGDSLEECRLITAGRRLLNAGPMPAKQTWTERF